MGRITIPHNFTAGTPAVADDVDENFDTIAAHINAELVHVDGSVPMTGALTLPGNAATALQAVPLQQVNALIGAPAVPGFIGIWGGASVPAGWLACDGAAVSRTTFAALFAAIGTTHGAGNGSSTFNVPDLRGRGPIGAGAGPTLTPRTAGQQLGEESMQAHQHNQRVTSNPNAGSGAVRSDFNEDGVDFGSYPQGIQTDIAGAGQSQNMQPSTVVLFVIKS